jgi:hypothetical protein
MVGDKYGTYTSMQDVCSSQSSKPGRDSNANKGVDLKWRKQN